MKRLFSFVFVFLVLIISVSCNSNVGDKLFKNNLDSTYKVVDGNLQNSHGEKITEPYVAFINSDMTVIDFALISDGSDSSLNFITSGSDIIYTNTSGPARIIAIKTDSTSGKLIVDAPDDELFHYGTIGSEQINAVKMNSLREFGKAGFIEIKKGRIALESTSEVSRVHFTKTVENTTEKFDNIVVALDAKSVVPEFSRDVIEISSNGTLVVELQNSTNQEESTSSYIFLCQEGILEQMRVSTSTDMANSVFADSNSVDANTFTIANDISNAWKGGTITWENAEERTLSGSDKTANVQESGLSENEKEQAAEESSANLECSHTTKVLTTDSNYHWYVCSSCNAVLDKHSHSFDENEVCTGCSFDPGYVASIGTKKFSSLESALDAVKASEEIKVLKDITYTGTGINKMVSCNFSINGDNHTVEGTNSTSDSNVLLNFDPEGGIYEVDITDLKVVSHGFEYCLTYNSDNSGLYTVNGDIRDCTITSDFVGLGVSGNDLGNSCVNVYDCTISNVVSNSTNTWQNCALAPQYDGVINVYGGTYTGTDYCVYIYTTGGIANIYSGSFSANTVLKAQFNSSYSQVHQKSEINVYGGSFTGSIEPGTNSATEIVSIQGGVFNTDPSAYVDTGYGTLTSATSFEVKELWSNNLTPYQSESNLTINTAEELARFALSVNNGLNYANKTITLGSDIDLSGKIWEPIGGGHENDSYSGLFTGTFDGNNKTISNMTVNRAHDAALFGALGSQGCESLIKDLTIFNADVSGENHVAAIVAHVLCGSISNCDVKDSSITANYSGTVGHYDDGDKAGAICGYFSCEPSGYITSCTVSDTIIKGYRDVGGLTGYVGWHNIPATPALTTSPATSYLNNCILTNVTILNDRQNNYKNYTAEQFDVHYMFGDTNDSNAYDVSSSIQNHFDMSNNTTTNVVRKYSTDGVNWTVWNEN